MFKQAAQNAFWLFDKKEEESEFDNELTTLSWLSRFIEFAGNSQQIRKNKLSAQPEQETLPQFITQSGRVLKEICEKPTRVSLLEDTLV